MFSKKGYMQTLYTVCSHTVQNLQYLPPYRINQKEKFFLFQYDWLVSLVPPVHKCALEFKTVAASGSDRLGGMTAWPPHRGNQPWGGDRMGWDS